MTEPLSVVVPARDEAETIGWVITQLRQQPWVGEVVVVDNGSTDDTLQAAKAAGARTVSEPRTGMGHALRAGLKAARHDWVMKVDADLDRFDISRFAAMAEARAPGVGLIKGNWQDPADNMPMTRLLVVPALAQLAPGLRRLKAPNSGIYIVNRALIAHREIVGSYAADLDVMLRVYASGAAVAEVDIGRITHDSRDLGHYNAMAETIMAFFMDRLGRGVTQETVVMANDAGDVIDAALGLLVSRARAGSLVHVYLEDHGDASADILRDALSPFPTARVLPLELAAVFRPRGPEDRIRLLAPYPSADRTHAVRTALSVQARLIEEGRKPRDMLLMPAASRLDVVRHFRADFAFDTSEGATIKAEARAGMAALTGTVPQDSDASASRETFQSYASLPGALKLDLSPDTQPVEASGPA